MKIYIIVVVVKYTHFSFFVLLPDPKALLRYGNEKDIVIMLRLIIQIARSKNEQKEGSCSFKGVM
jgi:hypothetical protein